MTCITPPDSSSSHLVLKSSEDLAVDVETVVSLLRIDEPYDESYLVKVIKHCTASLEERTRQALIHKEVEVIHSNPTIILPFSPVHKIVSVHKRNIKSPDGEVEIPQSGYECKARGGDHYLHILPAALEQKDRIEMGLEASGSEKKYYKDSHLSFVVKYEAGRPSSSTKSSCGKYSISDSLSPAHVNKLLALIEEYINLVPHKRLSCPGNQVKAQGFVVSRL